MRIIINGKEYPITNAIVCYSDVLKWIGETNMTTTVTYARAYQNRSGTLCFNQRVEVQEGTIFNACRTDNA